MPNNKNKSTASVADQSIINDSKYNVSLMTSPTLLIQADQLVASTPPEGLSRPSAEEYLRNIMKTKEIPVSLTFKANEPFEVSLTPNLVVKSIRAQHILNDLIIGDQILTVNGKTPLTVEHAQKLINRFMPKLNLVVGRITYKDTISIDRANKIQLKRQSGHSYFLTVIRRVGAVHLGLGIKLVKGKITINRTDENSLAAYIYLVGDVILDINGEKVSDVNQLRVKMIESMKTTGQFTTIVERAEPNQSTHNVHFGTDKGAQEIDPPLANDVTLICQREIVKYQLCNRKKRKIRGIMKNPELTANATQADETIVPEEARTTRKKRSSNGTNTRTKTSQGKNNSLSGRFDFLDLSSSRKKRQKAKKHVSINMNKNEEEKISTDVQNPIFLQHVKNLNKQGLSKAFTFFRR